MKDNSILSYKMTEQNGEFVLTENSFPQLKEGEVLVKVAGCGVCHTDISFWHYGVKVRHPLPLTLGHEISGTVISGSEKWLNKNVIIPAVLPCGECELCRRGRSNICQKQLMPGNDFDGGFATHIKVPSKFLCEVPENVLSKYSLETLAVIADAVTTPYQVIKKSELIEGDAAIILGVGGIGIYGVLLAKILGAKVIALDINDAKLQIAEQNDADVVLNIKDLDIKTIKSKLREFVNRLNVSEYCWKIFEMSGTKAGQELAFALLSFASTLSIVGFTLDKLEVRLSNLMAFDASLIGTWGCKPELYPEVLELVANDKLKIDQFVQTFPLSKINEVFKNTLEHKYTKRSVLVPDFNY
ncbi:MAG: 6-hydroxycyclohex-1-ene-1-carbonyl-CoA dehydrogenase [Ignavibacteriota bacterium]|nr:MAG: 6-hydroxycyclohex-1-ene-1-carbonyl-CoA dehydrogenase [Ignavibacteriota bacterium]